jgi:hypothetical protein
MTLSAAKAWVEGIKKSLSPVKGVIINVCKISYVDYYALSGL